MTMHRTTERERQEHRAWAQRVLGKPVDRVVQEGRDAEVRAQVEAEVVEAERVIKDRLDREEGRRAAEQATRFARAVTAPRDPRPSEPVGTRAKAADGTVWRRES